MAHQSTWPQGKIVCVTQVEQTNTVVKLTWDTWWDIFVFSANIKAKKDGENFFLTSHTSGLWRYLQKTTEKLTLKFKGRILKDSK